MENENEENNEEIDEEPLDKTVSIENGEEI